MESQKKPIEKGKPIWTIHLHDSITLGLNFWGVEMSFQPTIPLEFTPRWCPRRVSPDLLMKGSRMEEHLQGEDGSQ